MRISHKYKFIFIAIPRTGSFAVREALSPFSQIRGTADNPFYYHMTAAELKTLFARRGWDFGAYFKFSFVRNPWTRLLSQYRVIQKKNYWKFPVRQDYGFSEWCFKSPGEYRRLVCSPAVFFNRHFRRGTDRGHYESQIRHLENLWKDQTHWVFDQNGQSLVDYTGRYENLQEDFDQVCRRIGVSPRRLEHFDIAGEVPSAGRDLEFHQSFNEDLPAHLDLLFKRDMENFGYSPVLQRHS